MPRWRYRVRPAGLGRLTSPEAISRFMFGAKVDTDWEEGSPITWTGEYEGKPYQDKGEILEVVPRGSGCA